MLNTVTLTETLLCIPPVTTTTVYEKWFTTGHGIATVYGEYCAPVIKHVNGLYCHACTPTVVTYVPKPPLVKDSHTYVWEYYEEISVSISVDIDINLTIEVPIVITSTVTTQSTTKTKEDESTPTSAYRGGCSTIPPQQPGVAYAAGYSGVWSVAQISSASYRSANSTVIPVQVAASEIIYDLIEDGITELVTYLQMTDINGLRISIGAASELNALAYLYIGENAVSCANINEVGTSGYSFTGMLSSENDYSVFFSFDLANFWYPIRFLIQIPAELTLVERQAGTRPAAEIRAAGDAAMNIMGSELNYSLSSSTTSEVHSETASAPDSTFVLFSSSALDSFSASPTVSGTISIVPSNSVASSVFTDSLSSEVSNDTVPTVSSSSSLREDSSSITQASAIIGCTALPGPTSTAASQYHVSSVLSGTEIAAGDYLSSDSTQVFFTFFGPGFEYYPMMYLQNSSQYFLYELLMYVTYYQDVQLMPLVNEPSSHGQVVATLNTNGTRSFEIDSIALLQLAVNQQITAGLFIATGLSGPSCANLHLFDVNADNYAYHATDDGRTSNATLRGPYAGGFYHPVRVVLQYVHKPWTQEFLDAAKTILTPWLTTGESIVKLDFPEVRYMPKVYMEFSPYQ
ncbi:hypothetical protein CANCADRAFT_666 [Tortispora caseinolytica NRRL Y-17796]|uniref:Uncharacterized protein n=1 Tax=Tortispora caseinolytica NRRL Y-17796 TaxID=767744 RepID=A0A1E4TK16_9ASCO|nr:hypothetical protein CANCADRAFT_666 [Tortispora caseinolytica NRRL Y-17796]